MAPTDKGALSNRPGVNNVFDHRYSGETVPLDEFNAFNGYNITNGCRPVKPVQPKPVKIKPAEPEESSPLPDSAI